MNTRREFLSGVTAAMGSGGPGGPPRAWAPAPLGKAAPPNVLLITADDLNWDSVGAFGCRVKGITPHIDRLASEGMRFTRAHVTVAVCQPSRSALMTGRYPHRNGAEGFGPIREEVTTLQERLRAAGYWNGILAKNPHLAPRAKFCWDADIGAEQLGHGRDPALYYQQSLEFFRQAKAAGRPFFLMANSQDPHRPFAGSERELKPFGRHLPYPRKFSPDEVTVPGFLPDLPGVRQEIAEYFTSAHRCDQTVGKLLRALEESGAANETLVMFLSDNGMSFPFAKTNCYLHSTRTPWIVRWPGRAKAGAVCEDFISGIDFTPTVIEAAGLKEIEGMDGRSFVPLLEGRRQPGRDHVFTVFHETSARKRYEMRAVQDRRLGYIFNAWADGRTVFRNEAQGGLAFAAMQEAARSDARVAERVRFFLHRAPEELYDYQADPDALRNLVGEARYRADVGRLRRLLAEHLARTGDPAAEAHRKVL